MARLDLVLDDELNLEFRKAALEVGQYKKGALSDAFAEAVTDWLKKNSHRKITKNSKTSPRSRFTE